MLCQKNKSAINRLDNCIKLAVAKIFNVKDDNVDAVTVTYHIQVILLKRDVYILLVSC